ncbi:ALF repeat-containing protein [Streptomyces sp. NPDC059863]|uniref:ALF repeat-containing protein n=1 Tax=unclassified Streptomyces TaxID=2593676 RepID=UPI0036555E9B
MSELNETGHEEDNRITVLKILNSAGTRVGRAAQQARRVRPTTSAHSFQQLGGALYGRRTGRSPRVMNVGDRGVQSAGQAVPNGTAQEIHAFIETGQRLSRDHDHPGPVVDRDGRYGGECHGRAGKRHWGARDSRHGSVVV